MLRERSEAVLRVVSLLKEAGFRISDVCSLRSSCFDVAARKGEMILLIKVLANIDSFQDKHAFQLKLLSCLLSASPILIGERTRKDRVEDDVLYERFSIPAFSYNTLKQALIHGVFPTVYAKRGGFYVQLNGNKIKQERERESFSLGTLAEHLGVSRRAIYEYERKGMDSTLDTAIKLEELFGTPIATPFNIFSCKAGDRAIEDMNTLRQIDDELEESVSRVLSDLGLKVIWAKGTPFDAITYTKAMGNVVVTGIGYASERRVQSRIEAVGSFSSIVRSLAMFVLDHPRSAVMKGVPVVSRDELESMEDASQLLETISTRRRDVKQ
nr:transcriptional regulator [Candidatus Njordarchaeum guaymaensis]